tara:strand:- start:1953 stop:2480 length:528 start_codon:yes stop_codon:yes gene_type:complete
MGIGAGILPMAINEGKVYFLFSRERPSDTFKESGMWSDFGGADEKDESAMETAIREGYEESSGLLGTIKDIIFLVKKKCVKHILIPKYVTYVVLVDYDPELPQRFEKDYKIINDNFPEFVKKSNGYYEKDKLMWIEKKDLKKNLKIMRPWYREVIQQLINEEAPSLEQYDEIDCI